ncbi:hypothetical protein BpHYR1_025487 [Brachionus plicatilis]|uniref:Uncharacterized protein n=1 Tax=Brachionus plicatilis TaxID=10195 RepID=A0A3M7PB35_BRAPC|nr:hypothetical protein BpHYR1_025487 [Brachionus plicatilis]
MPQAKGWETGSIKPVRNRLKGISVRFVNQFMETVRFVNRFVEPVRIWNRFMKPKKIFMSQKSSFHSSDISVTFPFDVICQ